jgi:hypothetical protein
MRGTFCNRGTTAVLDGFKHKFYFQNTFVLNLKRNTQNASENSFLYIRIQNTTRHSPPLNCILVATNETAVRKCSSLHVHSRIQDCAASLLKGDCKRSGSFRYCSFIVFCSVISDGIISVLQCKTCLAIQF